jgi:prevent-host-death family protein
MASINISQARAEFPEILNRVAYGKERIGISRRGKPLAAVVPIEDLHLLERLLKKAKKGYLRPQARKLLGLWVMPR